MRDILKSRSEVAAEAAEVGNVSMGEGADMIRRGS